MLRNGRGITLIALIITIIVLLILAGVSINAITGDSGVLNRANTAAEKHKMEQAKEKLNITLANAGGEKRLNYEYNQDEFLDDFIEKEIEDVSISGDIVIVDGYAFELDRSVPKIGKDLGKRGELNIPEVILTVTSPISEENRGKAKINIKAIEKKKGINKIEVIKDGVVIKEYLYDNVKEQIIEDYIVVQNGKYIVKAYSDLTGSKKVEISGLMTLVQYTPNGNSEYKQSHSVKINISPEATNVTSIKYQWLNTTDIPDSSTFSQGCNNGVTLTKNGVTGKWYLWVLVQTEAGESIERSEAFCLDNQGPTVTLTSSPVAVKKFTLTAKAIDNESGISGYKFYVGDKLEKEVNTDAKEMECEVELEENGEVECYVEVKDGLGNSTRGEVTGKPKKYEWEVYDTKVVSTSYVKNESVYTETKGDYIQAGLGNVEPELNEETGEWSFNGLTGHYDTAYISFWSVGTVCPLNDYSWNSGYYRVLTNKTSSNNGYVLTWKKVEGIKTIEVREKDRRCY